MSTQDSIFKNFFFPSMTQIVQDNAKSSQVILQMIC